MEGKEAALKPTCLWSVPQRRDAVPAARSRMQAQVWVVTTAWETALKLSHHQSVQDKNVKLVYKKEISLEQMLLLTSRASIRAPDHNWLIISFGTNAIKLNILVKFRSRKSTLSAAAAFTESPLIYSLSTWMLPSYNSKNRNCGVFIHYSLIQEGEK